MDQMKLKTTTLSISHPGISASSPSNTSRRASSSIPKPQQPIIPLLLSSLSLALNHFFPLAGRLATTKHDTSPPSLSVFIDCNDEGAEFIHATATDLTISDILSPPHVPPIVQSFFPLNGAVCHDGHFLPLLAVQATELADGVFLGCSINHAVVDGTSFWHFINSWSEISRSGRSDISRPVVLDRWFPESCTPPIRLPVSDIQSLIKNHTTHGKLEESFFHFSAGAIRKIKAEANMGMETGRISSLQALLAHVWRCVVRARKLEPDQETGYAMAVGCRSRLEPPVAACYFGNCMMVVYAKAVAGELVDRDLGWAARKLNELVASQRDAEVRNRVESWMREPQLSSFNAFKGTNILTGSSPRFDVYGNDFGWGRPIAVRSGGANTVDGKATVFPGLEEGCMDLEICLSPHALRSLLEDHEFMIRYSAS